VLVATTDNATAPRSDPTVITARGPTASIRRPTQKLAMPATSCATVNAPSSWVSRHPSAAAIVLEATTKA
jgi:hypothetical protein